VGGDAEMTDLRREIKSIDEELDRDHRREQGWAGLSTRSAADRSGTSLRVGEPQRDLRPAVTSEPPPRPAGGGSLVVPLLSATARAGSVRG
jgi:hypothetical protein